MKEVIIKDSIAYLEGESKPYTGKNVKYYENGNKKQEDFFINGKRNGKSTVWDETEKLISEDIYEDGVKVNNC